MASEALKAKWKMYFTAMDTNHDGVLSHKDVEYARDIYSELRHFDEEKKNNFMERLDDWWTTYITKGRTDNISESDFVEMLNDEYKRDGKKVFDANMSSSVRTVNAIHVPDPGHTLTEEDFRIGYQSFGLDKIAADPESFQAFNPVNGRIPNKEFIDAWVEFLTDNDGPKGDLIQKQFEKHGSK